MRTLIQQIKNDFAASYWLQHALETALRRDPVDALNDAEILVLALEQRLNDESA